MEYTQELQLGLSLNNLTKHQLDESTDQMESSSSAPETTHDEESYHSDCESSVSAPVCDQEPPSLGNGLIELHEGNRSFDHIKTRFLSCLGSLSGHCSIISIHINAFGSVMGQAKFQTFQIFSKVVQQKHGGIANVKYAWYAATRDEIIDIFEHGFGPPKSNGIYGHGVYFSSDNSPMECVRKSVVVVDELRYLLLCRVLLGKSEVVAPFSDQSCPSSPEFDSGVDNLSSPKKYIIWTTHMNTHVLPEFILCFKAPADLRAIVKVPESLATPTSQWIPLPTLISAISKFLPPSTMRLVLKHCKDQREKKISRFELIQEVRRITGDKMLVEIIKSFIHKVPKSSGMRCNRRAQQKELEGIEKFMNKTENNNNNNKVAET